VNSRRTGESSFLLKQAIDIALYGDRDVVVLGASQVHCRYMTNRLLELLQIHEPRHSFQPLSYNQGQLGSHTITFLSSHEADTRLRGLRGIRVLFDHYALEELTMDKQNYLKVLATHAEFTSSVRKQLPWWKRIWNWMRTR